MAKSIRAKKRSNLSRTPVWAIVGVILLILAASGGWVAYGLSRQTSLPTTVATAQIGPRLTPTVQSTGSSRAATLTTTLATTGLKAAAYGVVTAKQLNLRAEPSTTAVMLGTLKSGDIVPLVRRSGGWYQTTEGGWLSALHLEVRQTLPEAESYAHEIKTA